MASTGFFSINLVVSLFKALTTFCNLETHSLLLFDVKGSDHCYIGNYGTTYGCNKTHLTGCTGEIIGFHRTLNDQQILYIHEYLMRKWGITDTIV